MFIGPELKKLTETEHELGLDQSPFMRHAQRRARHQEMIKAHVNEMGIVMRFDSMADNLSSDQWTTLLDQLKSHYIPSFYQLGKRMHVDFSAEGGGMRAVVYFTPQTVSMDEAIRF